MAKEETISMEGRVQEILPNTMFRVLLDDVNTEVIAYLSGKMRTHNIKVLLGDRVAMEFSPYDLTRGRITRRRLVLTNTMVDDNHASLLFNTCI